MKFCGIRVYGFTLEVDEDVIPGIGISTHVDSEGTIYVVDK